MRGQNISLAGLVAAERNLRCFRQVLMLRDQSLGANRTTSRLCFGDSFALVHRLGNDSSRLKSCLESSFCHCAEPEHGAGRAGHRGKVNNGHPYPTIGGQDNSGLSSSWFRRTRTMAFQIQYITFERDEQMMANAINKREKNSQAWEVLGKGEVARTCGRWILS